MCIGRTPLLNTDQQQKTNAPKLSQKSKGDDDDDDDDDDDGDDHDLRL